MNDVLRDDICRGRLCTENNRDRLRRLLACLDLLVLADRPEEIQLLSLVLMQTLGLDIKDRFRIDLRALMIVDPRRKCLLVLVLDGHEVRKELLIVLECEELLELVRIVLPAIADLRGNKSRQARVALTDPASERNAVRLVVELLRIDLVERGKLRVL